MGTGSRISVLYITAKGLGLAKKLSVLYPQAQIAKFNLKEIKHLWDTKDLLIFIMAAGIVVRTIARLMRDKRTDPAVVILDEKGRFAVSLLAGHLGGANIYAKEVAAFLKGRAVITTSSDVNDATSIDIWARDNDLVVEDWRKIAPTATQLLNSGSLKVYTDVGMDLPDDFTRIDGSRRADIIITNKTDDLPGDTLILRPRDLIIGVGCNSGTEAGEIEAAVKKTLKQNGLSFLSIESLATLGRKADEPGLIAFAKTYNFQIHAFSAGELNTIKGVAKSEAAFKATGAQAVAEPAALLASGAQDLLVRKQKVGNVTVAVAERPLNVKREALSVNSTTERAGGGKWKAMPTRNPKLGTRNGCTLYIVGTGPGNVDYITPRAKSAIEESDAIVGYGTYLDLVQELIKEKEIISMGMTREVERCRKAVDLALSGKTVSVISGGDPGIFAMAGPVLEILKNRSAPLGDPLRVSVEVIPGISALNACAARLGAPLMHDFAAISLSDRLTPWSIIEKRLEAAAMADFVIVLYNPKSKGRRVHIDKAAQIILSHRAAHTPVGIVRAAMRHEERVVITTLQDMASHDIDMQTTVIIGNSQTFAWNNWMVTPRGYESKFEI